MFSENHSALRKDLAQGQDCLQNNSKSYHQILIKTNNDNGTRNRGLNFGVHPEHHLDPGVCKGYFITAFINNIGVFETL